MCTQLFGGAVFSFIRLCIVVCRHRSIIKQGLMKPTAMFCGTIALHIFPSKIVERENYTILGTAKELSLVF